MQPEKSTTELLEEQVIPLLRKLEEKLSGRLPEWLPINEDAACMGLEAKHVRRAIKRGDLSCSNVGHGKRPVYRIAKSDLDAWVQARKLERAPLRAARSTLVDEVFGKSRLKQKAA